MPLPQRKAPCGGQESKPEPSAHKATSQAVLRHAQGWCTYSSSEDVSVGVGAAGMGCVVAFKIAAATFFVMVNKPLQHAASDVTCSCGGNSRNNARPLGLALAAP
jgi:hypothetical protein